ncbi:MAG: hypothetical protein D6798_08600 [Deltaproteobacteria bacterium]|nr:MAG: hypothetical protein D6798_08600 [Deltaproteobacteria bacterium]
MKHLPLALAVVLAATGPALAQDDAPDGSGPSWKKLRVPTEGGQTVDPATAAQLAALGYVDGYQTAPDLVGVTRYDEARAQPGLNLFLSGHDQVATVMDMQGKVLHTWSYKLDSWPDNPEIKKGWIRSFWRQVHVYDDGSILVLYGGQGLVKLTADSRLVWKRANMAHHLFEVQPDGRILTLTRHWEEHPEVSPDPVLVDYLAELDADGNTLRELSLLDAVQKNPEAEATWRKSGSTTKDIFHANSVATVNPALADKLPGVEPGMVLVSLRDANMLVIVDPATNTVVWSKAGGFHKQHDAEPTPDGRILLFDNHDSWVHQRSAVEIYDPVTWQKTWSFAGSDAEPFWTQSAGVQHLLDNGNVLIVETEGGRAFEVTPDGSVVWEFYNPNRAGEHDDLIAAIYDVQRVPLDAFDGWLKR